MTVTNISNTTYNIDEHSFVNSALYLNNIEGAIAAGEQAAMIPSSVPQNGWFMEPEDISNIKASIAIDSNEFDHAQNRIDTKGYLTAPLTYANSQAMIMLATHYYITDDMQYMDAAISNFRTIYMTGEGWDRYWLRAAPLSSSGAK